MLSREAKHLGFVLKNQSFAGGILRFTSFRSE
jgi:hypothetical protein